MVWRDKQRSHLASYGCLILYALAIPLVSSSGFLEDEIPLEIVSVTPSKLLSGSIVEVKDKQTITVVFSRPVIALGADFGEEELPNDFTPFTLEPSVDGRLRWVTTYIARFDVTNDWPRDLEITLTWNKDLTTYDGVPLKLGSWNTAHLETPHNTMSVTDVVSAELDELTGNNWAAEHGMSSDILPEVPYDGVIGLRFGVAVSLAYLEKNLQARQFVPGDGWSAMPNPNVKSCDFNSEQVESRCANVTIADGRREAATKQDADSGKLRSTEAAVPFKKQVISPSILRLTAEVKPEEHYRIHAINSTHVRDAFGQPLQETHMEFETDKIDKSFAPITHGSYLPRVSLFERGPDWGSNYVIFTKGDRPKGSTSMSAWIISNPEDLATIAVYFPRFQFNAPLAPLFGRPNKSMKAPFDDPDGEVNTYDIRRLMSSSGVVAFGRSDPKKHDDVHFLLLAESHLMMSAVSYFSKDDGVEAAFLVTDMATGEPVDEVLLSFFRSSGEDLGVTQAGLDVKTGKNGVAVAHLDGVSRVSVVLQYGRHRALLPSVSVHKVDADFVRDSLILDRKLLQPSETLYIKGESSISFSVWAEGLLVGYIRELSGSQVSIPDELDFFVEVTGQFGKTGLKGDSEAVVLEPEISRNFGSYETKLKIPAEAGSHGYVVALRRSGHGGHHGGDIQTFFVGRPRLPTVELALEATPWVAPDGEATLTATATSFIGSSVGKEDITVKWSVTVKKDGNEEEASGEEIIVTNKHGVATMTLDLSTVEGTPIVEKSVLFDVQWVGPTGELLEESAQTRIAYADLVVQTNRTVKTDIPRQKFGAWVELTDLDGNALPKNSPYKTALISLKLLPEGIDYQAVSDTPLDLPPLMTCGYKLGEKLCEYNLPTMGVYILESCVSGRSVRVCRRDAIGKSAAYWKEHPWKDFLPIGIELQKKEGYKSGDRVVFLVDNPYKNVYFMIHVGNVEFMTASTKFLKDEQRSYVSYELPKTCQYTCSISFLAAVPRQDSMLVLDPVVPVAKLHDPAMPHAFHWTSSIRLDDIEEKTIEIEFDFPRASVDGEDVVVAPGDRVRLNLELSTKDLTQVTVMIVDKAVLDTVPNPLRDPSDRFKIDLSVRFDESSSGTQVVSPTSLDVLIADFERKKKLDPWFDIVSTIYRNGFNNEELDLTDEEYVSQQASYLTVSSDGTIPGRSRPQYSQAAVGKSAYLGEGGGGGGIPDFDVRIESEFEPNVLFATKQTRNGKLSFYFDAPEKLGAFVVRACAASGVDTFGSAETQFIVRRDVSLTPSVPRFARVKDEFLAGAIVTVTGSPRARITFSVDVEGPLRVVGPKEMMVQVGGDKQEVARFKFEAVAMGEATLTFRAEDKNGNRDAVQVALPVEGLQESVVIATSFTLAATSDRKESSEGLDLPPAVPGSGTIEIVAGVGQEPTVMSLVEQLLGENTDFECPYYAGFILGATLIPGIINPYSPWNAPNQAELMKTVLDLFEQSADLISVGEDKMTRRGKGLLDYLLCEDHQQPSPKGHLRTNARALWLMDEVQSELDKHPLREVRRLLPRLQWAKTEWRAATAKLCIKEAEQVRKQSKHKRSLSLSTVALCRLALGADWDPPRDVNKAIREDLSMKRLESSFNKLDLESQAMYILTLQKVSPRHKQIGKAVKRWTGLYRVTGRTAYISASQGAATPASRVVNALILMAMTRAGNEGQLLPKLAAYVASPAGGPAFGYGYLLPYATTVTMWSLVVYDASRDNTLPDVEVAAFSGDVSLLEAVFNEYSPSSVTTVTDWEDLGPQPQPISFTAVGYGEVSIAALLNFVPVELQPFPSYRGIFVQRTIHLEESGEDGVLSVVPEGSVVFVRVQFMTPDSLQETIARVLMPAGLEPVDPNIAGDDLVCPVPFYSYFSFLSCPEQETEPTVVTFDYTSVTAGSHVLTFKAVAVTPGIFTLPPTRVFVKDQPEVMGLSSAGEFTVCTEDCEAVYETEVFQPKSCPKDCNGNGTCNLADGTCRCFEGFRGETCTPIVT